MLLAEQVIPLAFAVIDRVEAEHKLSSPPAAAAAAAVSQRARCRKPASRHQAGERGGEVPEGVESAEGVEGLAADGLRELEGSLARSS